MTPNTNDKYIGIEIECMSIKDEDQVWELIERHNLSDYVDLDEDGSIEPTDEDFPCSECGGTGEQDMDDSEADSDYGYTTECHYCEGSGITHDVNGHELKVLAKQSEVKIILGRVKYLLRDMDAKVNDSCGLHVHLDMRNRPIVDSANKLLNMQHLMLKSVPKHRRQNSYCRPVKKNEHTDVTKISKYHVVHTEDCLVDKNTIEVRVHEGTVDTDAIYKWVKFLVSTIDGKYATAPRRTVRALPVRIKKYMQERMRMAGA